MINLEEAFNQLLIDYSHEHNTCKDQNLILTTYANFSFWI